MVSSGARPTASERNEAAMLAIARVINKAAKREQKMWIRFAKEANALTRRGSQ